MRNSTLKQLFCFFFACLISQLAYSDDAALIQKTIAPQMAEKITDIMNKKQLPGVAIAIFSKENIYYLNTFGVRKLGTNDKITPQTLFQIASNSKPFTSTLMAILQEKGRLSFDDPVSQFLPAKYAPQNPNITLRDILSHRSGMPKDGFDTMIEKFTPRDKILSHIHFTQEEVAPGKQYIYHNALYGVLGDVISQATGQPYEEVLKQEMFNPLNMTDTNMGYDALLASEDRAYPHMKNGQGIFGPAKQYSHGYYIFPAAAGINASVSDLVKFLQLSLGKYPQIISQQALHLLMTPQIPAEPELKDFESDKRKNITDISYGLGWQLVTYLNTQIVYHSGHLNGFRSFIGIVPDNDIGIIILTNSENKYAFSLGVSFFDLYSRSVPGTNLRWSASDPSEY